MIDHIVVISWIMKLTTGVIIYCRTDQNFTIHISHHVWSDEYNSRISIEDNQTPGSLLLKQRNESLSHYLDLINLIPCELDLASNPFCDTAILKYEIELPTFGKENGFNLLDDKDFTIPYVFDKTPNPPAGHQLPKQFSS